MLNFNDDFMFSSFIAKHDRDLQKNSFNHKLDERTKDLISGEVMGKRMSITRIHKKI